jgi:hypothetical protein
MRVAFIGLGDGAQFCSRPGMMHGALMRAPKPEQLFAKLAAWLL